ncbi:putative phosphothreonine lyase domain-containing protein [Paraburkholderia caledonica]
MDEQSRIEELLSRTSDRPAEDFSRSWQMRKSPSCGIIFSGPTTGKWCIFAASSDVDSAWSEIKTAVEEDELLFAKVANGAEMHADAERIRSFGQQGSPILRRRHTEDPAIRRHTRATVSRR